jgi:hypothetical protein
VAFEDRRNRVQYPFQPGGSVIFTLPPGLKVLRGNIILAGQIVVSGGTVAGTVVGEGGPINLVKRIMVTANRAAGSKYPGGRIVDVTPRSLVRYAIVERNGKFVGDFLNANLGNGANGTYTVYLSIPIYFADATLQNQMTTALNMDLQDSNGSPIYSSVQVQVDCASDLTGCFAGNNAAVNWAGLSVQWEDTRLAITADTVPLVQEDHYALIGATQTRMIDPGMPVDGSFTSWLVMAEQNTANKTLSQALLNRVTAFGSTINLDQYALDIQQQMIDDEFYDPATTLTGQYFFDFTKGILQNSNPAAGIDLKFDVNCVTGVDQDQLHIYTRRVYALAS